MKKIILIIIFILASVIRLYHISYFASFGTETAEQYLEIIKLLHGDFLLNGPTTSHVWLRLGAIPYYLFFPILYLARFHPLTLFYFWVLLDISTVFLNYYVIKKIINENTALLTTLFLSLSPLALTYNRIPGFYNFVIPLTYILLLLLYRILHKKSIPFWPVFLVVGLMINLHASSLILIPFFIGLGIYLKKFSKFNIITSIAAILIPNVPFFIKDYLTGFSMSRNLLLWIPYKILNFFSGKTLGVNHVQVQDETLLNIINFFKMAILPSPYPFIFGVVVVGLLFYLFMFKKLPLFIRILYYWLFFGIISLLIHKNPPIHYFVPIFVLPIILIAYLLSDLQKKKGLQIIALGIIVFIVFSDLLFIFSPRYLFLNRKVNPFDITYQTQKRIAQFIIQDAKGKQFSISKIGFFDTYAGGSKENYEYLLWWLGNRPIEKSLSKYIIVEDINRLPISGEYQKIKEINGVVIMKIL